MRAAARLARRASSSERVEVAGDVAENAGLMRTGVGEQLRRLCVDLDDAATGVFAVGVEPFVVS